LKTNLFVEVDGPVQVVQAIRSDISAQLTVFPTSVKTFFPEIYQIISFTDAYECGRTYNDPTWNNQYGFGDSAVNVYVGGAEGTSNVLNPGDSTIVEIDFYNNAGFDWNLRADAMEFDDLGSAYQSAADCIFWCINNCLL
jgi:hypothetical protein